MDYNHSFDSREHDSGYFTPSPDKDNKLIDSNANYNKKLESINNNGFTTNNNNTTNTNSTIPTLLLSSNTNNTNTQNKLHHSTHKLDKLTSQKYAELDLSVDSSKKLNVTANTFNSMNTLEQKPSQHQQQQQQQINDADRPPHSYIALISMAILSKSDRKILLNEIYDWVIQNFPYYQFRTDKSWRNSIRHNLSLNECFVKVGKAGNGRGYYWSIHSANMNDFKKGDFRRRQARLRAKHDKTAAAGASTTTSMSSSSSTTSSISSSSAKSEKKQNAEKLNHHQNHSKLLNQSPINEKTTLSQQNYMLYAQPQHQQQQSTPTSTPTTANKCYNPYSQTFSNNSSTLSSNNSPNSVNLGYSNQSYHQNLQQQHQQQQAHHQSNYTTNSSLNYSNYQLNYSTVNHKQPQPYQDYSSQQCHFNSDLDQTTEPNKFVSPNLSYCSPSLCSTAGNTTSSAASSSSSSDQNCLQLKANNQISTNSHKLQSVSSSSLSTSPSSSSSSSSSSSYFYPNYNQNYLTNHTNNNNNLNNTNNINNNSHLLSSPSSISNHSQYNYINSFSWLPSAGAAAAAAAVASSNVQLANSSTPLHSNSAASNFLESFNSSTPCSSYELTFPYRI